MNSAVYKTVRNIPVVEVDEDICAQARGLIGFKRIAIGNDFNTLSAPEQLAVLEHEAAHCLNYDMEIRIVLVVALIAVVLYIVSWATFVGAVLALIGLALMQEVAHRQEYRADRFAATLGHGEGLRRFLKRYAHVPQDELHPSTRARLRALDRKENA